MPLTNADWREIQKFVGKMTASGGEPFVQCKVIGIDISRNVVFAKEFGDIPIPIVAHYYQVTYSSRDASGRVIRLKTQAYSKEVEILLPQIGDTILVAQHLGTRALPKCLGVIQSKDFVVGD